MPDSYPYFYGVDIFTKILYIVYNNVYIIGRNTKMNKTIFTIVIAVGFGILPGQLSISQGMDVKIGDQPELEKSFPSIEQIEAESDQFLKGGPPKKPLVLGKRFKVYNENTVIKIDDEGNPYIGLSMKELRELEIPQTPATPIRDDEHGILFSLEHTQAPTQEPEKNTFEVINDDLENLDELKKLFESYKHTPMIYDPGRGSFFRVRLENSDSFSEQEFINEHLDSIHRIDFADYLYDEDEKRFYLCNTEDFLLLPEKSDAEKIANMVELGVGPNEIKARLKAQAIHDTQKRADTQLGK